MDLAYLRAHPEHIPTFLFHQRIRETPVSGGETSDAVRLTLDDGSSVFAKRWPGESRPHDGFFEAQARGLRWLRDAHAVAVPEVITALPKMLVLEWVEPSAPSASAARRFGRELAALHRSGADGFGSPWPNFIGSLPLPVDDHAAQRSAWPDWFASYRLEPYLRRSADTGALSPSDVAEVGRVLSNIAEYAGAAGEEPPARLHGDLWPGNLLWTADRVWLIDPAAQGGHRETDLATLALFGGAPYLDEIMTGYTEVWPLTPGVRTRRALHQLHLLLVHTALFGSAYRDQVLAAVRATVES